MEADSILLDQAEPTDHISVISRPDKQSPVEAFSVASSYPHTPRAISGLSRPEHAKEKVDKGPKVSFMTTLDRELFPTKMPQNRFGNEICPLRGAPHRGPGCYENEEKTNFWYDIEHKINSSKGYTLGARTGPRFYRQNVGMLVKMNTNLDLLRPSVNVPTLARQKTFSEYQTPSPTAYQTTCTDAKTFDVSKKAFLVGADRFPVYRRDLNEVLPGAGAYEHEIKRNRQVQWHQSFGGTPVMMPEIQVRSIIDRNTEKLYSTKEEKKYNRKLAYMKLYYE